MKHVTTLFLALFNATLIFSQALLQEKTEFTRADTLRGKLNSMRTCYDVTFYDLSIKVDPDSQFISGTNVIDFTVMEDFETMQIDLFENMDIHYILFENDTVDFKREYNAVFVDLGKKLIKEELNRLIVNYSGKPIVAFKPPWDGGFVWEMDEDSNHWVGVACEGIGASLWWPNKDHLSDEPDSMMLRVTVPDDLMNVSGGRLVNEIDMKNGWKRWDWFVSYPINNYNVTVNIGNYAHFSDVYVSGSDSLALDYYVMPYNLEKAKQQFEQVKPMMECFEKYFGPYPFWRDGYKLVETSYLGMEHQGAIAYGNRYKTGYAGMDYSGIGLDFDYIIIHETGHEWWGNAVSCRDMADLWLHEGFCTYSEALYVECLFDYETAINYVNARKSRVGNNEPIIGHYDVNKEGSSDMYRKGMLLLNTLRHIIDDDELWFDIVKSIATGFSYEPTTSAAVEQYIMDRSGRDLGYFFDQYLRHSAIPVFEYRITKKRKIRKLEYRWIADVKEFRMPIKVTIKPGEFEFIYPTLEWQEMALPHRKKDKFMVAEDLFYVEVKDVNKVTNKTKK